jgi:hypothetical protein
VAEEARRQTRDVTGKVGGEVRHQVDEQKHRLTHGLQDLADELADIADTRSGMVAGAAGDAAERTRQASTWLEQHEPRDLLTVVEDFARRRPVLFLMSAAAAGAVVGRLTRGMVSANGGDGERTELAPHQRYEPGYEAAPPAEPVPAGTGLAGTGVSGSGITGTAGITPATPGVAANQPVTPLVGESDAEAARRRAGTETQEPM